MAAHLRIGSVINWGGTAGGPYSYPNAVVTNITPMYLEFEWTDPATSEVHVLVKTWTLNVVFEVVTD